MLEATPGNETESSVKNSIEIPLHRKHTRCTLICHIRKNIIRNMSIVEDHIKIDHVTEVSECAECRFCPGKVYLL